MSMNQVYIERDGTTLQVNAQEYLKQYKKQGWRCLGRAIPLFTTPEDNQIKVNDEDLRSQQTNMF